MADWGDDDGIYLAAAEAWCVRAARASLLSRPLTAAARL